MGATILRRRWSALGIATVALAATLVGCAPTDTVEIDVPAQVEGDFPAETQAQLDAALAEAMAATGSSGAIVGVWAPWSGSWVAGVGTQSPTNSQAVTSDMEFRAARVTRAMTCDVLYALVDREVVALDDEVSEYVGGASGLEDVSLGQVCDSTSGIGASAPSLWNEWIKTPNREWPPLELAAYGMGRERTTTPGAAFVDSDAGYVLLGVALTAAYADPDTGLTVAVVLNNSAAPAGIAANLAWELAAIASKAPAAAGETAPAAGLPWTAEQQAEAIRGAAVCPLPQP